MKKGNIVFVTEASFSKGLGHYKRSLSFAGYLKTNYKIFFFKKRNIKNIKIRDKTITKVEQFHKIYKNNQQNIIIYDVKKIESYKNLIKNKYVKNYKKIFVYDKIPNFFYDLLIIPYIIKKKFKQKNILSGHKFVILKENFFKPKKSIKKFIICCTMGGSDINGYTYKIIELLSKVKSRLKVKITVNVIIGSYFNKIHKNEIIKICKKNKFKYYLNPKNYETILNKSSLLITNSGNSKYEAAALGKPFIIMSNDRKSIKHCKEFSKFIKSYYFKNFKVPNERFLERKIKYVIKYQNKVIDIFKSNKKIINKKNVYYLKNIIKKI